MTPEPPLAHLPAVTSPASAADRWRLLLGLTGVREPEIWVQVFDAYGAVRAPVVVVDELPVDPEPDLVADLVSCVAEVLARDTAGIGSVAVALARPEGPGVRASDLAWASAVAGAARREEVRVLSMHLVTPTARVVDTGGFRRFHVEPLL